MKFFKQTGASTLVYAVSAIGIASAAVFAVNSLESSIDNTLSDVNTQIASVNATIADGVTVTPATIPIHHYAGYGTSPYIQLTHWRSESFVLSEFESAFTSSSNVIIFPTFYAPLLNETSYCSDTFSDVSTHQFYLTQEFVDNSIVDPNNGTLINLADGSEVKLELLQWYRTYSYTNEYATFSNYVPSNGIICVLSGSTSEELNNIQAFTDFYESEKILLDENLFSANDIITDFDPIYAFFQDDSAQTTQLSEAHQILNSNGNYFDFILNTSHYLNIKNALKNYAANPHSSGFLNSSGDYYSDLSTAINVYIDDATTLLETYSGKFIALTDYVDLAEMEDCTINITGKDAYNKNTGQEICQYLRDAVEESTDTNKIQVFPTKCSALTVNGSTLDEQSYHYINIENGSDFLTAHNHMVTTRSNDPSVFYSGEASYLSITNINNENYVLDFWMISEDLSKSLHFYFPLTSESLVVTNPGNNTWPLTLPIGNGNYCLYWQNTL